MFTTIQTSSKMLALHVITIHATSLVECSKFVKLRVLTHQEQIANNFIRWKITPKWEAIGVYTPKASICSVELKEDWHFLCVHSTASCFVVVHMYFYKVDFCPHLQHIVTNKIGIQAYMSTSVAPSMLRSNIKYTCGKKAQLLSSLHEGHYMWNWPLCITYILSPPQCNRQMRHTDISLKLWLIQLDLATNVGECLAKLFQ